MIGVNLQLFDNTTPQASLSNIQALWWDVTEPKDAGKPIGRSEIVTTDIDGYINLDLSNVSGLTAGDYGFLTLYKLNDTDHKDSLVFSGKVQTSDIGSGVNMQPVAIVQESTWKRNPAWPTLPTVLDTEQKVVGLHRVDVDANFVAFTFAGAYTVNWGDGVTENFAANATAYHQYTYTDTDLDGSNAPITFTDTGDLVNRTAHDYDNGDKVQFYNIINTTGIVTGQTYYVINKTDNNFQISETLDGSALALTTDGSATLLDYKLAIITVTPQAANDFTLINLHVKHNQSGLQAYTSGFLDIIISGTLISDLRLGVQTPGSTTQVIKFGILEQISLISSNLITDFSYMFYSCNSLTSITLLNTAGGITFSYMFYNCYSLTSIPLLNTAAGTSFSAMFYNCYSLDSIPLLNTAAGTNFSSMFQNCYSLTSAALSNTKIAISYASCKLSSTELNRIYTNLYGPVTSKTITVTGNYGVTGDDPSIATAKGWIVTG